MKIFPDSPEIKVSFKYDSFKTIEWNRDLNRSNLNKLISLNKDKFQLHVFPILVTKNLEVIDGQHRLEASRVLGSPVYYIVQGNDSSFEAVHRVNIAGKTHSLKDKIEMLAKSGDAGAITAYKISSMFGDKFDISAIVTMLVKNGATGSQVGDDIDKNKMIVIKFENLTIQTLSALNKSRVPEKYTVRACYALSRVSSASNKSPIEIMQRVDSNISKWINPKSVDEAIRAIVTCYNYSLSEKNRIEIKKGK